MLASSVWRAAVQTPVTLPKRFDPSDLQDFEPKGKLQVSANVGILGPRPNIILLVLESVAARYTSLHGWAYDTTPTLKAEATHGIAFDNFYAHIGRSTNSLGAMLFSTYPKLDFLDLSAEYPHLQGTSLASLFRDRGYRTSYATSGALDWAGMREFLADRGFDAIVEDRSLACSKPLSEWGVEDRCLIDWMLTRIGEANAQPYFILGWTTQTHYPYESSPEVPQLNLLKEPGPDPWDLGRYLNAVHEVDRRLARLFDALRLPGAGDTLVVITGDHGQAFGPPHDSYGQGRTAYEEDVHVPMLIWSPRLYPSGVRSATIGSHVDLGPTIAALTRMPTPPDWQGRSLFATDRPPRAYFYVAEDTFILGVREGSWKYLLNLRDGTDELYELDDDPDEQRDLAAVEPERSARLRQRLAAWMEANARLFPK